MCPQAAQEQLLYCFSLERQFPANPCRRIGKPLAEQGGLLRQGLSEVGDALADPPSAMVLTTSGKLGAKSWSRLLCSSKLTKVSHTRKR